VEECRGRWDALEELKPIRILQLTRGTGTPTYRRDTPERKRGYPQFKDAVGFLVSGRDESSRIRNLVYVPYFEYADGEGWAMTQFVARYALTVAPLEPRVIHKVGDRKLEL